MKISKRRFKVSRKQSDKFLRNMEKHGIKPKTKRIKEIVFHKEFDKGKRLGLCLNCGYAVLFLGLWDYPCSNCKSKKIRILELKNIEEFILLQQKVIGK